MSRTLENNLKNQLDRTHSVTAAAVGDCMPAAVYTVDTNTFDLINYLCMNWPKHYYIHCRTFDSLHTMEVFRWPVDFHKSMKTLDCPKIHPTNDNSILNASID